MKKHLIGLYSLAFSVLATTPQLAHASTSTSISPPNYLSQIGTATNLQNQGLAVLIGNLINLALSFLGIVLLLIVIYAGFLWMTAGGEEDQVKKAKALITNAVIGLVLLLSALAISTFVFSELGKATGATLGG
jgi:hypothetical protein